MLQYSYMPSAIGLFNVNLHQKLNFNVNLKVSIDVSQIFYDIWGLF